MQHSVIICRLACTLPIRMYQRVLSPDHSFWAKWVYPGGYCRFTPTCSEYACRAIIRQGVLRGGIQSVWRICRCNPWSSGGVDDPKTTDL